MIRKGVAAVLAVGMALGFAACGGVANDATSESEVKDSDRKAHIESVLNLANNEDQEWTYDRDAGAWVMSIVSAVAYPEIENQQGVSVAVPGAYVSGIDSNGDGLQDVSADSYSEAVKGSLVIDHDAKVTSSNGQVYTADTAPVILNTGAAGYSSSSNTTAATTYAAEGYINVACGNRGKQDTAKGEDGETYYTGDAPLCLIDQKNAARFVKYNILLGNLPGSVDHFVSTGGSGGGAHAVMFAATSNNEDFYDYEIEAGAVGVYELENGGYSTTVTIDGKDRELSDGAWGSIAYSAITSLSEADMAQAFEYYMDTDYDFGTSFQKQLAEYLSEAYMEYINGQNLSVKESAVGFDLNGDGDKEDTIALSIEYDPESHAETNGYYGTYLDLYLAEFQSNLQWYLDNLGYAEGWTWFDSDGTALSDGEVAAMTTQDKARAFIEGRYAKGSSGGMSGTPDGAAGASGSGEAPAAGGNPPSGNPPTGTPPSGEAPDGQAPSSADAGSNAGGAAKDGNASGDAMKVGTPDAGTTQAAGSTTDSANYDSYDEMVSAFSEDIASIEEGDKYGNNIVDLYNPLNYIGAEGTDNPAWTRIVMGASEGDMSLFSSLNLQIAMLNAGIDADIEWQWDGGHVPSETLSESFSLYVDQMYGEHADGEKIETPAAQAVTANGTATKATGTDISGWVDATDVSEVSFSLADAVSYRAKGASKAVPGFDVIDYGQEDYVFGNAQQDARHWDKTLLNIFKEHADVLEPLFNSNE